MSRRTLPVIAPSEITPESVYLSRRHFIRTGLYAAGAGLATALPGAADAQLRAGGKNEVASQRTAPAWLKKQVTEATPASRTKAGHHTDQVQTPYKDATHYNNFYEFGPDKSDPGRYGARFEPHPWSVVIDGEVAKPGRYTLEDLLKPEAMEERIYRLRCVEAWSMVIPWIGFEFASILRRVQPLSSAKYVAFQTLVDPDRMPAQDSFFSTIDWPYREGLRLDEAMHPLTLMVTGMYGKVLPGSNGAPLRLIVPWKYGFKSIKSIVRITLSSRKPETTWNQLQHREYGFYANVNPQVSHPRWSQARERSLPSEGLFPNWIPTRMFNGYEEQVAHLYEGMDLRAHY